MSDLILGALITRKSMSPLGRYVPVADEPWHKIEALGQRSLTAFRNFLITINRN